MRIVLLAVLCVAFGAIQIFAQSPNAAPNLCVSNLRVELAPETPETNELITAEALFDETDEKDRTNLKFNWLVAHGTLIAGQGTAKTQLKQTKKDRGANLVASVEITRSNADCTAATASATPAAKRTTIGEPVDEFGKLWIGDEKARLDNLVVQAANNPGAQALVLICAPKKLGQNYLDARVKRAFAYLVNARRMKPEEVLFGTANCATERTVLWIVPQNAKSPLPADYKLIEGTSLTGSLPPVKPAKNKINAQ